MKYLRSRFSSALLAVLFTGQLGVALSECFAQEAGSEVNEVGFIQIVNGVATDRPTFISFGDVENGKSEIPAGASSGIMGLPPGDYAFEVSNKRCKPDALRGSITLEAGKTFALVFFHDVEMPKEGEGSGEEEDAEPRYRLRHTAMTRQHDHDEPKLSLVSLSHQDSISVSVDGKFVNLPQYQAVDMKVEAGATVEVKRNDEEIGVIEVIAPVHYLGFLFDDPDSGKAGLGFTQIQHQRIVYDPPTEGDEEKQGGGEAEDEGNAEANGN